MQVLHLHPKQHGRCCLAARARLARAASRLVRTLPGRTHFSARAMALPLPARASLAHNLRSPCVCTPLCLCCTDLPTSTPPTPPPTARSRPTSPTVASRSEVTSSSLYYPHPILEIPPLSTSARRMLIAARSRATQPSTDQSPLCPCTVHAGKRLLSSEVSLAQRSAHFDDFPGLRSRALRLPARCL